MTASPQSTRTSDAAERLALYSIASLGFVVLHVACLLLLWLPVRWPSLAACLMCYLIRMFGITAGFHRYFAHRAYRTGRVFQCLLACLGTYGGTPGGSRYAG